MNIQRINNNCSFTSKYLISGDSDVFFDALKRFGGSIYAGQNTVIGPSTHTFGIATCIGAGAGDPELENTCLSHYYTTESSQLERISKGIKSIETDTIKPNIFITGGEANWRLSEESFRFLKQGLTEEFGQNRLTVLWGQKDKGATDMIYDPIRKLWIWLHRAFNGDRLSINKIEDLQSYYKHLALARGDIFIIGGKEIKTLL